MFFEVPNLLSKRPAMATQLTRIFLNELSPFLA